MAVLPKRFCFRFSVPCRRVASLATLGLGAPLPDAHTLPLFEELEWSGHRSPNAAQHSVQVGWHPEGFAVAFSVQGKSLPPRCPLLQPEQCDGLQFCLDTRDVRNVHRATRFCHRFLLAPSGANTRGSDPAVLWLPIARAKGMPHAVDVERIRVESEIRPDGYSFLAVFPADVLTGFDPKSYQRLGFHYALIDHEVGHRYWITPPIMPQDQDPSLWGTLELV